MIDNLLLDFFRENGRMTIPGKGIVLHVNIEDKGLDTVAFVNDMSIDGSEIIEYICRTLDTGVPNAERILDGYMAFMDSVLAKNGEYVFDGLGTLRLDEKGNVYMVKHTTCGSGNSQEENFVHTGTPLKDAGEKISPSLEKEEKIAVQKVDEVYEGNRTEDSELSEHEPPVPPVVNNCVKSTEPPVVKGVDTSHSDGRVQEFLDVMGKSVAADNAMEEVKKMVEEKERHERLSEIFTSKRCFNDEAGERRGEVSTLQMRLSGNEEAHIHSDKVEDLYKGEGPKRIADEQVEPIKENDMKTDVPENTGIPVKKKKRLDTVWVIFIIAVIILIGVAIYYFYEKNTLDGNINIPAVEQAIDQPVI